jgi:Domain of unknown function (DUF4345)
MGTSGGMERRLLQMAILIAGLVPVAAGAAGAWKGAAFLGSWPGAAADSHFRYLSGLLLALGLAWWACIPAIERRAGAIRILTFLVVVGGLARLIALLVVGDPGRIRWALIMELVVTPLLCLWQARLAKSSTSPTR